MKKALTLALAGGMFVLAACGSSTSESTDAGAASGSLGKGTIGIIQSTSESEVVSRWSKTAKTALESIGWSAKIMDGKGDPGVQGAAVQSLVSQKVKGIIISAVDAAPIRTQLEDAKAAGIPVIAAPLSTAGPGSELLSGIFAPEDEEYGRVLAEYLAKKLPDGGKYMTLDLTPVFGAHLAIVGAEPELKKAGFEQVGLVDLDPANLIKSTQDATQSMVQAHPEAKVLLSCCDFTPAATNAVLGDDHKDIIQLARYDNLSTLKLIRDGANVVVANANADLGVLIAIDQILAHTVNGTDIDPDAAKGKFDFETIDKTNLPPEGEYKIDPQVDIDTYVAKWKKEYAK